MNPKRRSRASVYAALLLLLIVLAIYVLRPESEPQFAGKRLDFWIQQYCHAILTAPGQIIVSRGIVRVNGRTITNTVVQYPSDSQAREEAALALQQIGPKAFPGIARALKSRENRLTRQYRLCSILLPWSIRSHLPGLQDRDTVRADAAEALGAFGLSAREMVPALVTMLAEEQPNTIAFSAAIQSLRKIGANDADIDPLLEVWTREKRLEQLEALFQAATLNTTNAALALCTLLESQDPSHQLLAYTTLRRLGQNALIARPLLLRGLDDSDVERRYQSVRTMEALGTNALPALPRLTALLHDTNVMVRTASLRCIKTISGAP
jgi:hypothetical protein